MSNPYDDRPRVYINWSRVRPMGWRGWAALIGLTAAGLAALALVAVVASTVLLVAIFAGVVAAIVYGVGSLFRPRSRDVGPYRGDFDA